MQNFIQLLPKQLNTKFGVRPTADILNSKKRVLIYFSASWCGACKGFTPILKDLYSNINRIYGDNILEIIFVSQDKTKESFNEYYSMMPWNAVRFEEVGQLINIFGNNFDGSIPHLCIVDINTSQIVDNNARVTIVEKLVKTQKMNDPAEIEKLINLWFS